MSQDHHDDTTVGRVLARREVLALVGTSAGAAVLVAFGPRFLSRRTGWGGDFGIPPAGAEPCVARPEQTEGPYFVDERLNRSDIRSDPSNGSVKQGAPLAIRFAVQGIAGSSCVPLQGALVDLWHCDAAGIYSDAQDPGFNTRSQKFLRGYQLTDTTGTANFITIYPGWYQGRTVHVHFKIRTDPESATGFEFTSQLYFDDQLTDVVHAQQPYAARGPRTTRNDGDGIYQGGGDQLLLAASGDGAGGYSATFDITLEVSSTTTTLAGGSCVTIAACLTNLQSALPEPATATSRKARRTANRLQKRTAIVPRALDRAAASVGMKQTKRYARAGTKLQRLLALSQAADEGGRLGIPLAPLEAAINALLGQIPQ